VTKCETWLRWIPWKYLFEELNVRVGRHFQIFFYLLDKMQSLKDVDGVKKMRVCEVEYNPLNHWICLHYYLRFQYGSIPCNWNFLIKYVTDCTLYQDVLVMWVVILFKILLPISIWCIGALRNTPSHPCQVETKDCILYETGQKKNRWLHLFSHSKRKTHELSCLGCGLPLADYLKPIPCINTWTINRRAHSS
jgi:hypothetical protein